MKKKKKNICAHHFLNSQPGLFRVFQSTKLRRESPVKKIKIILIWFIIHGEQLNQTNILVNVIVVIIILFF